MEYKQIGDKYIIRLDVGEELVETLQKFCKKQNITVGKITGLGATNKVRIGLYDTKIKTYIAREFSGDFEIAPLYGNITTMDGEPYLHLHINICDSNHNSYGGHLSSAIISVTFEGIIEKFNGNVDRMKDPETGLNILKLD